MAEILSPIQPEDNGLAFSDVEIGIIKKLFSGNDKMLMALRNFMLQFEVTQDELAMLASLSPSEINFLRNKVFIPRANRESKLQKISDVWGSLQISNMGVSEAYPHLLAREQQITYYSQRLDALEGKNSTESQFSLNKCVENIEDKDPIEAYVGFVVRNTILLQTDFHINLLRTFAGRKEETVEEIKKRLGKDSAE